MRHGLSAKACWLVLVGATVQCQTTNRAEEEKKPAGAWQFELEEPSPIAITPVGSTLADDPAASSALRELWLVAQEFNSVRSRQFVRFPAWKSPEYLQGLADVIADYPNTTAALTAQLELGYIYVAYPGTRSTGRRLLDDVETHSDTWQGCIAKTKQVTRSLLADGITAESERQVEELFPELERLERQLPSGLVEWKEHLFARPRYEFRAGLVGIMMELSLRKDDRVGATAYAERILAEFPDSRETRFARDTLKMLAEGYNPARPPPMKW